MSVKSILGGIGLIALAGFVIALFIFNASQPKTSVHTTGDPWNKAMTMGSLDAPHKMVEYTDYFCSFCAEFNKALTDDFKKEYVDSGKLRVENRIVDLLKEVSVNTPKGNRAAFCAADQNKYWEYSKKIIKNIDTDYFSKGIGVKNVANPVKIPLLANDYFITPAGELGLNTEKFSTCIAGDAHGTTISSNSQKAINMGVTGLPHITVNGYTANGFMGGEGELTMILKAGGVK